MPMKTSLSESELLNFVIRQMCNTIPDGIETQIDSDDIKVALKRIQVCNENVNFKYFMEDGQPIFDHLNGDHWSMFLYLLSHILYKKEKLTDASKLFNLNKALCGIDAFYEIELPDIFYFCHPLGSVLGNGKYEDYLVVYQGVTIGSDINPEGSGGIYPSIGKGCALLANTTLVGDCVIGENVILAANAFIRNISVPDNTIVLGAQPNHKFIENKYNYRDYYFGWSIPRR